jgi:hypothetical protein
LPFDGLTDPASDPVGDVRDDRVTERGKAVQPMGNPISHSTHAGFNGPPLLATCLCSSPPDPPWLNGADVGVLR